jgi:hypothetical protein
MNEKEIGEICATVKYLAEMVKENSAQVSEWINKHEEQHIRENLEHRITLNEKDVGDLNRKFKDKKKDWYNAVVLVIAFLMLVVTALALYQGKESDKDKLNAIEQAVKKINIEQNYNKIPP